MDNFLLFMGERLTDLVEDANSAGGERTGLMYVLVATADLVSVMPYFKKGDGPPKSQPETARYRRLLASVQEEQRRLVGRLDDLSPVQRQLAGAVDVLLQFVVTRTADAERIDSEIGG